MSYLVAPNGGHTRESEQSGGKSSVVAFAVAAVIGDFSVLEEEAKYCTLGNSNSNNINKINLPRGCRGC